MNICPNYKKLRRWISREAVHRLLAILLIILICEVANGFLHAYSLMDRRDLREAEQKISKLQEEAAERERINQIMLTARKEIQTRGVYAMKRLNLWSDDDKKVIAENWTEAEYFGIPNPFPEYLEK